MTQTQINGGTQIQSGTITTTQLSSSAGITDGQLADSYLLADGSRALTGNLKGGGKVANNFADPSAATDLATKGYVDAATQGISSKFSATAATTGVETYTISTGTVTSISGTTVDGVTMAVGEYLLIKDAPAASGTGSAGSDEPGNGLYAVTAVGTSITLSRASDMSGSVGPSGAAVFVEGGTKNAATGWLVTTPNNPATAFTYGVTAMQFTQTSAALQYTVDSTLVLSGTQLSRAAISGNVTIAAGSNTATIPASTVTVAMINASGTKSSSTFLRGDGTWNAPPAPAAGSITFAMLAGAAVTTSTEAISSASTDSTIPTAKAVYSYVTSAMAGAGEGTVTSVSVASANGFAGTVATASSTPAITIETTVTGLLKGNGTGVSAATAGTDYLTPSNYVVRQPLSGTINGSNTTFTLPSTPIDGTEMIFMNGILQEAGSTNDYQISGATVTFNAAATPDSGSSLYATYFTA